jgi:Ca2+-binding EF-hand superfamily protein
MKLITSVLAALALGTTLSFAADEKKPAAAEPAKTEAKPGEKKADGEKPKRDPAEAFKKLDANNDSKVSLEEFKAKAKDAAKAEEAFGKKDKDGDKNLTLEEFSAAGKKAK